MRSHPMHPLSYPTGKYGDVFLKKVTENIFKVLSFQLLIVEFLGIGLWFEISDILETLKIPTYKTLEWKKTKKNPTTKNKYMALKFEKTNMRTIPYLLFFSWIGNINACEALPCLQIVMDTSDKWTLSWRNGAKLHSRQMRSIWKRNSFVIGNLSFYKKVEFAKEILYFCRIEPQGKLNVVVTEEVVNLGDGDGIQVLCTVKIIGAKACVNMTQNLN